MLRATFQLTAGLGPTRERRLWEAGVVDWAQLDGAAGAEACGASGPAGVATAAAAAGGATAAGLLPAQLHARLCARAAEADRAERAGDLAALGRLLPAAEHWRLFGSFEARAVYLDIECDRDGISAVGLLDAGGPRLLLADRDLHQFPEVVPPDALLVTFNGAAFDLPHLRRAFPDWVAPAAHIDLCTVWKRLRFFGGLKSLEEQFGFGRPAHLRGLDGSAACWLWRHGQLGNHQALLRFAEYNLYDVINLRPLLGLAYNRLAEASGLGAPALPVSYRGDVLYDVSKLLLAL